MTYEKVKDLTPEAFKRFCGVKPETFTAMLEVLKKREGQKKKAGRPSILTLEDQLLLTLSYWREYRTLFHIATSYGVHESTAQRIVTRLEGALIASGLFSLPSKRELLEADHELVVVVVDSTETVIERPKKNNDAITVVRRSGTP